MKKFIKAAFADEAGSDISVQIDAMRKCGIEYLEIRNVNGKNVSNLAVKEAKEIRKQLSDGGISVWSIGSPYGKISIKDDFKPHLELFRRGLETASVLEAKRIRLFSFYIPKGEDPADYRYEVMERLEAFYRASEGSGIVLCHENEKGIYGDISERCADIHRTLPGIKAVFDPANFIQCGVDILPAWKSLSGYVDYLHIKDALPDGFVVPSGHGEGHIKELLGSYSGTVLTLEPHLSLFDGLKDLEQAGERSKIGQYYYGSQTEAFIAANDALDKIINEINTEGEKL